MLLGAALAACGERPADRPVGFSAEPPGTVRATVLLKADTLATTGGQRWLDLHVLLPVSGDEASARATLQHVIDSVAAADTLAVAVRAVGFQIGPVDLKTRSASIEPAISALWGPPDSVWTVGVRRTQRYRTHFTILRPLVTAGGSATR